MSEEEKGREGEKRREGKRREAKEEKRDIKVN